MAASSQSADTFAAAFDSFRSTAFRFESLQRYDIEEERAELNAFLQGERSDECSSSMKEWCAEVSAAQAHGKSYQRIRAIRFPLSDYTQFEILTGYRFASPAGEQIRFLEHIPADLNLAGISDFWLFDDAQCFWLRYNTDGQFIGVEQGDANDVTRCRELKERLWAASTNLYESRSWMELNPGSFT